MSSNGLSTDIAYLKPLLRGWSHAFAAVGAAVLTIALAVRTSHDAPRMVSMLVYGVGMVQLYTVSALYHIGSWRGRTRSVLRAIDHANIFVMIAGTFTPISFVVLGGVARMLTLTLIWTYAVLGILFIVPLLRRSRWAPTLLYLGMGWVAVVPFVELVQRLPPLPVALLLVGGALYTLGAIVYLLRRPNPLPSVFGFHEVFHVLVIGASAAFAGVVWHWVVPFT